MPRGGGSASFTDANHSPRPKHGTITVRATIALCLAILALATAQGCSNGDSSREARRAAVVTALDALAVDLLEERPADVPAYTERLQVYLEAHPSFFGSGAALLDRSGSVTASPYVYRTADGYASLDLATPSYNIEEQKWFTTPLSQNASSQSCLEWKG